MRPMSEPIQLRKRAVLQHFVASTVSKGFLVAKRYAQLNQLAIPLCNADWLRQSLHR